MCAPKSPILAHHDSRSPLGSQKTLSRQGTMKASHRRKSSMTGSLSLVPGTISSGRRSPVRSPVEGAVGGIGVPGGSGRRSPSFHLSTRLRSPNEPKPFDNRSPTLRSPTRDSRKSPTNSIAQERKSPTTTASIQVQCGFDPEISGDRNRVRTPTGLSIPILKRTSINTYTATQRPPEVCRTSPSPIRTTVMAIPPITVSNPSETCAIVERMSKAAEKEPATEKRSMMRELFSFVRKAKSTTSSASSTSATSRSRFASAFSRSTISSTSSSSTGPTLVRQSTYASGAIPKHMTSSTESSSGFEPRLSFKFGKMSLRLRRFTSERKKGAQPSPQHQQQPQVCSRTHTDTNSCSSRGDTNNVDNTDAAVPFELANVHFEKVGESYIKHDTSRRYNHDNNISSNNSNNNINNSNNNVTSDGSATTTDALDVVERLNALSNENAQLLDAILNASSSTGSLVKRCESREPVEPRISEECEEQIAEAENQAATFVPQSLRDEIDRLTKDIKPEPIYVNIVELRNEVSQDKKEADDDDIFHKPLNCPTIEFEPPSRRSSFDPPRSPYLENLRSVGSTGASTDTDFLMSRLNSGEDGFDIVENERRRESSFEGPVSSYTDMSRYQSTSYEDPMSSFEIIEMDQTCTEKRKSSIEIVDSVTLQRADSGRKMSLETHFDYIPTVSPNNSQATSAYVSDTSPRIRSPAFPISRRHRNSTLGLIGGPRSPLSTQTSSNFSSRDSYDSASSSYVPLEPKSPRACSIPCEATRRHFPMINKARGVTEDKTFLCTDRRCEAIFEPRPLPSCSRGDSGMGGLSSSSEFDPPSPRRCSSVSPKHMFTFKIVMKKVDSMLPVNASMTLPKARTNSVQSIVGQERRRSRTLEKLKRADSRKKRF